MKVFPLFMTLLTVLTGLDSCSGSSVDIISSNQNNDDSSSNIVVVNHSYEEIKHLLIEYQDIFNQKDNEYYVYIYASWCSYCNALKNSVIEYALNNDSFYFVNEPSDAKFSSRTSETIGINNVSYLTIEGYPTLLKIINGVLTLNISGQYLISSELDL